MELSIEILYFVYPFNPPTATLFKISFWKQLNTINTGIIERIKDA